MLYCPIKLGKITIWPQGAGLNWCPCIKSCAPFIFEGRSRVLLYILYVHLRVFICTSTNVPQLCTSVCVQPWWNHLCSARRDATAGGGDALRQSTRVWTLVFLSVMTTIQVGSEQGRRTKRTERIYSPPDGVRMCRRWSHDDLSSLLKWNMTLRELSAISCLAQEVPIWNWALPVLCCVA